VQTKAAVAQGKGKVARRAVAEVDQLAQVRPARQHRTLSF